MKTALATPTVPAAAAPIYCLGDSHVSFFAGADVIQPAWPAPAATRLPWFRVLHLGPILAFSLARPNTRERGRERLFAALERTVPPRARVLLCFGEIDCRAHFLKQAARQGRPVEAIVTDCLAAYFHVVQDVQQRGFEVIVYNAIATRLRTPPASPAGGRLRGRGLVVAAQRRHPPVQSGRPPALPGVRGQISGKLSGPGHEPRQNHSLVLFRRHPPFTTRHANDTARAGGVISGSGLSATAAAASRLAGPACGSGAETVAALVPAHLSCCNSSMCWNAA